MSNEEMHKRLRLTTGKSSLYKIKSNCNVLTGVLCEMQEENERLNNIINELEKFTNARIQKCYDEGCYIQEFNVYNEYDSKIKELRGDSK